MSPPDLAIQENTYADLAYDKLRSAIVSGTFAPGCALRERELVIQMGISRTPIREALQRLANDGILEMSPYRGARVRILGEDEARQLFELRRALEGQSAEYAALRATDSERAQLTALARGSTVGGRPTATSLLVNQRFHEGIAQLARNERLSSLIGNTIDLISLWRTHALSSGLVFRNTADEHMAIIEAIVAGDAAEAGRQMIAHIDASWETSLRAAAGRPSETIEG